jgi:tRNA-binding protein
VNKKLLQANLVMKEISWKEFEKVEIRVGTILEVDDFPEARNPSYKITIDFGPEIGIRKSSAQLTALYSKEDLIGKQILGVVNFKEKQIANFMSECLITGVYLSGKEVVFISPERKVPNGLKLL